jgi:hypothetical protein
MTQMAPTDQCEGALIASAWRDPPPCPAPTIGRPEGRPSFDGLWGAGTLLAALGTVPNQTVSRFARNDDGVPV